MTVVTPGKARALTQASNEHGIFTVFAIDHRDAMRMLLDPDDPAGVPADLLTEVKLDFVRAMNADASAVLLDPEYSAIEAVGGRVVGRDTGLLVALENQGYLGDPEARVTTLLEGWSVEKAKRLGASGIKLLLLYRPDSEAAAQQDAVVADVVTACARWDIPLFLEPIPYPLPSDDAGGPVRRELVVESVRRLGALGPDIMKVPFPEDTAVEDLPRWRDACAELDEVSPVPWALLSGGDPYRSFRVQVQIASESGSSGFLVGRALWGEAAKLAGAERRAAIEYQVRPRFVELAQIATTHGTSWYDRVGADGFTTPPFSDY